MNSISLVELAKELGVNKSKLAYFQSIGLIQPEEIIGQTGVFDREKTIKIFNHVIKLQKSGKKLKEIKALLG